MRALPLEFAAAEAAPNLVHEPLPAGNADANLNTYHSLTLEEDDEVLPIWTSKQGSMRTVVGLERQITLKGEVSPDLAFTTTSVVYCPSPERRGRHE